MKYPVWRSLDRIRGVLITGGSIRRDTWNGRQTLEDADRRRLAIISHNALAELARELDREEVKVGGYVIAHVYRAGPLMAQAEGRTPSR